MDVLDREELNDENRTFSHREVMILIWSKPRKVLSFIDRVSYDKHFFLWLVLAGIYRMIALPSLWGNDSETLEKLIGRALIGALLGWVTFYIGAAVITKVGRLFGGVGSHAKLFTCLVYSFIPAGTLLILAYPSAFIVYLGESRYVTEMNAEFAKLYYLAYAVMSIGLIWSLINVCISITIVHKVSYAKAIIVLTISLTLFGLIVYLLK